MTWRRTGFIDETQIDTLPHWLNPIVDATRSVTTDDLTRFSPVDGQGRGASVLVLFGEGPDVLLIERARGDVAHSGQPAFPGGARESFDSDEFATALREAQEETGVSPAGVQVFGALPDLWVPVSDYVVSPVLAYWRDPNPVGVQDSTEVSRVERVAIEELVEPSNRCTVVHPSGYRGPGFRTRDMLIWGFTAGVLSGLLDAAGWARPWDADLHVPVEL